MSRKGCPPLRDRITTARNRMGQEERHMSGQTNGHQGLTKELRTNTSSENACADRHGKEVPSFARPTSSSSNRNAPTAQSSPTRGRRSFQGHERMGSGQYRRSRDHYSPRRRSISPPPLQQPLRSAREQRQASLSDQSRKHRHSPSAENRMEYPLPAKPPTEKQSPPLMRTSSVWRRPSSPVRRPSDATLETPRSPVSTEESSPDRKTSGVLPRSASMMVSEKVHFNGLENVPTGPSKQPTRVTTTTGAEKQSPVPLTPHIYIPALKHLTHIHPHLCGFLKHTIPEDDIQLYDTGWYIVFQDSHEGRRRLEHCYKTFNHKVMFGQYHIKMQCFPHVQKPVEAKATAASHTHQPHAASIAKKDSAELQESSTVPQPPSNREIQQNTGEAVQRTELDNAETGVNSTNEHANPVRPLPVTLPPRHERDDSSSVISARTGSEVGGPKRYTCHRCNVNDIDPLVACAFCPRRYHRRCHAQPKIPENMDASIAWRCGRCVKKGVGASGKMSAASLPSSAVATPEVEGPPAKRRMISIPASTYVSQSANTPSSVTAKPSSAEMMTGADEVNGKNASGLTSSDPDNLVERSFTADANTASATLPKKSFKLNLTRRKMSMPRQQAAGGPQDLPTMAASEPGLRMQDHHMGAETIAPDAAKPASTELSEVASRETYAKSGAGTNEPADHLSARRKLPQQLQDDINDFEKKIHETFYFEGDELRMRDPKGIADLVVSRASTITKPTVDNAIRATNDARPALARPTKRKAPQMTQCLRCERRIAVDPAAKGIQYCSKCRDGVREPSNTPVPEVAPTSVMKQPEDGLPAGTMSGVGVSASKDSMPDIPNGQSVVEDGTRLDQVEPSATGKLKNPRLRAPCATCRARHRRCTHLDVGPPEAPAQEDEDTYEVEESPTSAPRSARARGATKRRMEDDNDDDEESDDSSPLSSAVTTPDPISEVNGKKPKRSFRVAAEDEYDVGNSIQRPRNSYEKLIGMALCSAQDYRMTQNEIVHWIADNIPSYTLGEGNWQSGVKATMTFLKVGKSTYCDPLWRGIPVDPDHKHRGHYLQLLEGMEDKMLHWDPVLKKPVSPPQHFRHHNALKKISKANVETGNGQDGLMPTQGRRPSSGMVKLPMPKKKQSENGSKEPAGVSASPGADKAIREGPNSNRTANSTSRLAARQENDSSSDDDEPLQNKRLRQQKAPPANMVVPDDMDIDAPASRVPAANMAVADEMDVDAAEPPVPPLDEQGKPQTSPVHQAETPKNAPTPASVPPVQYDSLATRNRDFRGPAPVRSDQKLSLAEIIKREADSVEYAATSLFDEWPEYDPSKTFDKEAKLAEIKARPNRKQRARIPSQDPWFEDTYHRSRDSNADGSRQSSSDRSARVVARGRQTTAFADALVEEAGEGASIKICETWEEFFDTPKEPLAIIHDGVLAYRDGRRNEDGTLPRAKVTYRTGYA